MSLVDGFENDGFPYVENGDDVDVYDEVEAGGKNGEFDDLSLKKNIQY